MLQSSTFFLQTLFLAHVNHATLAAGSLATWLYATVVVILFGTLSSINILVSHKFGAGDHKGISLILRDGLILSIIMSIPIMALVWKASDIFLWFGQNQEIVTLAKAYLHAIVWGLLPNFMTIAFLEFLIGLGRGRILFFITLLSALLNIGFSFLLIFGRFGVPAYGIAGAGWGMVIANWITLIFLIAYVLMQPEHRKYFQNMPLFHPPVYILELLRVGIPMGLMYCIEVGFFFILTLAMGRYSRQLLAANQIVLQYLFMFMSVIFSLAQAVTVRMGHLLGVNKINSAFQVNYIGIAASAAFMLIISGIYWWIPNVLISLDLDIQDPNNFSLINDIKSLLSICAVFQIFEAIRITLFGALRSLKDTRYTLFSSVISFWGIALPMGYLSANYFGGTGYWYGMIIGVLCNIIALSYRLQQFREP